MALHVSLFFTLRFSSWIDKEKGRHRGHKIARAFVGDTMGITATGTKSEIQVPPTIETSEAPI
jgi:hypothetical protein